MTPEQIVAQVSLERREGDVFLDLEKMKMNAQREEERLTGEIQKLEKLAAVYRATRARLQADMARILELVEDKRAVSGPAIR